MLTIKSMKQIRTSRNVRNFHACLHATGVSAAVNYKARLIGEEKALMLREARRLWLDDQWREHFARAAGPLRVLPPAAREQQASTW
jgi:nucleotidyltransferase/DNA polymerase involved in DNA repair